MINSKFIPSNFCANCCSDDVDVNNHHHHVSISTWLKSELPEIKVRCSGIFSGKFGKNRHHRGGGGGGNAVEFRYDPLSYALNFEDDHTRFDELPPRNFSARLPPSPPPPSSANKNAGDVVVVSAQIAAYS